MSSLLTTSFDMGLMARAGSARSVTVEEAWSPTTERRREVATKKSEPFGGKRATPFGQKEDDKAKDTKKKTPAKKTSRGK
jgi:hypothetical protein